MGSPVPTASDFAVVRHGGKSGLPNTAIGFSRGVPTVSRAAKGGQTFSGMMTKDQRRASINFRRFELLGNAVGSPPKIIRS